MVEPICCRRNHRRCYELWMVKLLQTSNYHRIIFEQHQQDSCRLHWLWRTFYELIRCFGCFLDDTSWPRFCRLFWFLQDWHFLVLLRQNSSWLFDQDSVFRRTFTRFSQPFHVHQRNWRMSFRHLKGRISPSKDCHSGICCSYHWGIHRLRQYH